MRAVVLAVLAFACARCSEFSTQEQDNVAYTTAEVPETPFAENHQTGSSEDTGMKYVPYTGLQTTVFFACFISCFIILLVLSCATGAKDIYNRRKLGVEKSHL